MTLIAVATFLPPPLWSLLCGVLLTVGDITLRAWFVTQTGPGFWLTLVVYAMGLLCMMMSCFGQNIAVAGIVAVLLNSLGYIAISYWWWGDTISAREALGIALGLVAVLVLETKI